MSYIKTSQRTYLSDVLQNHKFPRGIYLAQAKRFMFKNINYY